MFILYETSPTVEDNIKVCLEEIRHNDLEWIHLVQDKLQRWCFMNTVMKLHVPYNVWEVLTTISSSSRILLHGVIDIFVLNQNMYAGR
jgi:hypothetical protein